VDRIDPAVKKAVIAFSMRVIEQSRLIPSNDDVFSTPFAPLNNALLGSAGGAGASPSRSFASRYDSC